MANLPRLKRGDTLLLATHNAGKLSEFRELCAPLGLVLVSAKELGLPEPEETGTTFVENARLKAHAAAKASGRVALADDSGLSVDALNGEPGVYTADWATSGNGRDYHMAMKRVEDRLQAIGANSPGARRSLCGESHRHHGLATARRAGLRLRPDVHARRLRHHLRRDAEFGQALLGSRPDGPVAPRPRLR
jgi:hypothetical protein